MLTYILSKTFINVDVMGFKIGWLTWEQRKLGEIADVYDGVHQTPDYQDSGVMFLSVENIKTLKSNKYISEKAFEKNFKIFPEQGDILMTRIGDIGTTNIVQTSKRLGYYVSLALLKPKNIASHFLNSVIATPSFQISLKRRSLLTATPQKINKDEIGKVYFFMSQNLQEQEKIGQLFQSLDRTITLHEEKQRQLERLKKALLQKMFADKKHPQPELRFKGFSGDWEQRKLGDVIFGFKYGLNTPAIDYDGQNKYLRITDIDDNTHQFMQDKLTSPKNRDDSYLLKSGDILFARTGASVGKTYEYHPEDGKVYYAGFLIKGSTSNNNDASFIFFSTLLNRYIRFVKVTSMRSGQPGINANEYKKYSLYIPQKNEQCRISKLLKKIDAIITLQQKQIDKLNSLKKSLLQNMFI